MKNFNKVIRQYNQEKATETFKGLNAYEALDLLETEGVDLYTVASGLANGAVTVSSFDGAVFYDMVLYLKDRTVDFVDFKAWDKRADK